MFIVAAIVLGIYLLYQKQGRTLKNQGWRLISLFFFYIAIDDATRLHERIGSAVESEMESGSMQFLIGLRAYFFGYHWQMVLGPIFLVMGLYILFFVWRNMSPQKWKVVLALGLYSVAVVMDYFEAIEGWPYPQLASTFGTTQQSAIHYSKGIEEVVEMLGTTFLLIAFSRHFMEKARKLQVQFSWHPVATIVLPLPSFVVIDVPPESARA